MAVATTLISFAAVAVALPGAAAALSISLPTGVVAKFLLNAAVSIGAYYAAKIPLQRIGNKALDLTEETANDRIFDIKRAHAMGKSITPAQVLDVYTKGNPGLDIEVIREFGKPYDKLGHEQQELAVAQLDSALKLTQTAQDINSGRILATELAFMTAGQTSGVPPTVPEQRDAVAQDAPQMTSTRFQDKLGKRDLAASFTDRVTQESSSPKEHHI
ncbi:MAG: hypothetical protein EBV03_02945 [Proteobacteria bacterium]|nr:hypothetical protein [Pseudomonadota bacterium]